MGKKPKFIDGLRITDEETMDIVKMVLVGKINTAIVGTICFHGGKAVGLSGKDGQLLIARKKAPQVITDKSGKKRKIDLGLVGEIEEIRPSIINLLTENDYIPVISPVGVDRNANTLNLNADTVAGEIASKINAEKLIILTDVPGILEDPKDPETLIKKLTVEELQELIKNGTIRGGMVPKALTCIEALNSGVSSAHIIDGRIKHSLLLEIFTDEGIGTMIVP